MCTGTATAPECEANLEPPSCMIDAECSAACEGQASFEAECTPPTVTITGFADAMVQARVTDNLPAILEVFAKGQLAAEAAVDVGGQAVGLVGEISAAGTCALKLGDASWPSSVLRRTASASVNVSVMASASCNAEATGAS